jgi:SAM-dependent methyltransferase
MIQLINPANNTLLHQNGDGYVDEKGNRFPVINNVLRFVPNDNYTASFGFQWNRFQKTQIDRESRNSALSKERFFAVTGWDKIDLTGKNILEAGSGAGRFTQIVLDYTKATLYSFDYSDAVSANFRNNGHHGSRLKLFQASIYDMPFPDNSFDKVFCFGVLHLIEKNAGWLIKVSSFFTKIGIGKIINRFLPVCDIKGTLPTNLSKEELKEWVVLDTFDMYSPEHDHPQRIETVKGWFEKYGMTVTYAGTIVHGNNYRAAVVKGTKK